MTDGICPQCGCDFELQYLGEDFEDADFEIQCTLCEEPIEFGDEECNFCHTPYDNEYWRTFFSHNIDLFPTIDITDDHNQITTSELTSSHTLCCDNKWEDCKCPIDDMLGWHDATFLVPKKVWEEAYTFDTPCSGCLKYYEGSCIPLRHWVREYLETNEFPGGIDDICSQYDPWNKEPAMPEVSLEDYARWAEDHLYY